MRRYPEVTVRLIGHSPLGESPGSLGSLSMPGRRSCCCQRGRTLKLVRLEKLLHTLDEKKTASSPGVDSCSPNPIGRLHTYYVLALLQVLTWIEQRMFVLGCYDVVAWSSLIFPGLSALICFLSTVDKLGRGRRKSWVFCFLVSRRYIKSSCPWFPPPPPPWDSIPTTRTGKRGARDFVLSTITALAVHEDLFPRTTRIYNSQLLTHIIIIKRNT